MIFSGKLKWIKWGIIIMLIGSLISIGWLYRSELKKSAKQAQQLLQYRTTVSDLEDHIDEIEKERQRLMKLVDQHSNKIDETEEKNEELKEEYKELKNEYKEVDDWANTTMPDPVYKQLRSIHKNGNDNQN